MITNDAVQPFTAGAEDRVPHHDSIVGAGLVPALDVVFAHDTVSMHDGSIVWVSTHDVVPVDTRATTRIAPTLGDAIGAYKSLERIRQYINRLVLKYGAETVNAALHARRRSR